MMGDPAYPVVLERNTSRDPFATPRRVQFEGLTKREWFAGMALQGALAGGAFDRADRRHDMLAQQAFMFADAMLAASKESVA